MGRVTTRVVLALLCLVLVAGGCGDDDAEDGTSESTQTTSGSEEGQPHGTTTRPPETGGIEVPDVPGTYPVAVPSAGFGIAIPEGWQATILTDEAIQRLEDAELARPSFLDAARRLAATGAVFYAAGVDEQERVSELKIDVRDDADTSRAAMMDLAGSVVESGQVTDGVVVDDDPEDGRVRVDYRIALPSAEDGGTIDALGSQIFVADGDRLWSFIVTSEDTDTQTALLQIFDASITFDDPAAEDQPGD